MEKNKKPKKIAFRVTAIIAFIVILMGMVLASGISEASVSVASAIILVLLVSIFLRYKFPERYQKDERTKKLGAYALAASWMISFILAGTLFWALDAKVIVLSGTQSAGLIFAVMAFTMIIFQGYFLHKGDA
ncbi:hypothetical protein KKE06_03685 [Candidatus Micrarchaeota archaeon]|nr:hypothetical protein [Candidatus Micrarchaeota archaeon]MBU1930436.1 hypothetical protein [Candidatus Micrarchaeota archaeon]